MTLGIMQKAKGAAVLAASVAALCIPASTALAQDRLAFVLGTSAFQGQRLAAVRDDTSAVSRRLLSAGFDVVRREDAAVRDVNLLRRTAPLMVLYFSGQVHSEAGEVWLLAPEGNGPEKGWPLFETLRKLRQSGAGQVVAIVENCHTTAAASTAATDTVSPGAAAALAAEAPDATAPTSTPDGQPAQDTLPAGVFLAMATGADGTCPAIPDTTRLTDRFLTALSDAETDVPGHITGTAGTATVLNTLPPGTPLVLVTRSAAPEAKPEAAPQPLTIDRVTNDTVQILSALSPITPAAAASAPTVGTPIIQSSQAAASPAPVSGTVRIVDVSPSTLQAAIPTPAGLPRPSIIVGEIRPQNASFSPTEDGGALAGTALDATGFEAREQIRKSDPELYARLVSDGAFDPDAAALPAALQTALQRMGCYGARIDGDWGNGSRAAVDRYYTARGDAAPTREATIDLFRSIIMREDVACPVQQQAANPTPRATTGGGTTARATNRTTQAAPATPRRTTTSKPAAPAAKPRTIDPSAFGSGAFR